MEIIAIIFIVISVAVTLFFGFKHLNKKIQQKYTLIDAYNHHNNGTEIQQKCILGYTLGIRRMIIVTTHTKN